MSDSRTKLNDGDLRELTLAGLLSPAALERHLRAMGALPAPADWRQLFKSLSLALGAGLLVSGIIFFFAANWPELHKFHKLGLAAGALAGATLAAVIAGLHRSSGRILLTAAAMLAGGLLALYGQIYQTGADAWELFFGWSLLILPWTLIGRFRALWFLQTVIVLTTINLFEHQEFASNDWNPDLDFYFLTLSAIVALLPVMGDEAITCWRARREGATDRPRTGSSWLVRAMLSIALAYLLAAAIFAVDSDMYTEQPEHFVFRLGGPLYFLAGVGVVFYWTRVVRDLFPLAVWALGGIVFVAFYLAVNIGEMAALFVVSIVVIGMAAGVAAVLRWLQQSWRDEPDEETGS